MKEIQEMADAIKRIVDANDSYTQEDFDKQFVYNSSSTGDLTQLKTPAVKITVPDHRVKMDFVNTSPNPGPTYATEGSSGFDLRSAIATVIPVGKRFLVPTGLFFNIPPKLEIQVRPRSGLAVKFGITVLNSPGTVDSDYRGEVMVPLINHGEEDFVIEVGDRIAQAVVGPCWGKQLINLNKVDEISTNTDRGTGGFNSTGFK